MKQEIEEVAAAAAAAEEEDVALKDSEGTRMRVLLCRLLGDFDQNKSICFVFSFFVSVTPRWREPH